MNRVILQRHDRPAQTAGGDHLVSGFQLAQHMLPFLLPPLLRHDQKKVKDRKNKDQRREA